MFRFEAALRGWNAAIVVATESHRESLLLGLQAVGLDMGAAMEDGISGEQCEKYLLR